MAEIAFRPEASIDLAGIHVGGTEQFGPEAADRYLDSLQAAIKRLATYPQLGPIYPGIRPPIRYLAHKRHHIFYEYDGTIVLITRILHHAQDARMLL